MSYLTENLYFQSELYNPSSTAINAEKVDNLLAPIVNDSSNWSVAIAKANVPISTIPLTVDNIGLRRYSVTISDGTHINTTFVPQINSTKQNFLWDSEGTIIYKRIYTSSGAITTLSSVDYAPICGIAAIDRFIVDDFQNVYLTGPTAIGSPSDVLYIVGLDGTLLDTAAFSNIVDLYIDRGQKLYIADGGEDQRVYIYNNTNGLNSVVLTEADIISQNFAGDTFTGLAMVSAGDNVIIVGYDSNKLTFYDQNTFTPTHDLTETAVENIVDGVILDSQDAYALLGADQPKDTILGTKTGGNVFNVLADSAITSGFGVKGKYAVCPIEYGSATLQGLVAASALGSGTLRNASFDPTISQALSSYIALPQQTSIASNKQTAIALGAGDNTLRFLNMYPPGVAPVPSYWNTRATKFYITTPGDVLDFDYNIVSDKLFVVDSAGDIKYSDMPITPVYIWSVSADSEKVEIYPISFFGSNTTLKATLGRQISIPLLTSVKYDTQSDNMFTLEGAFGSREINSRNSITGAVIQNYPCPGAAGNINTFTFADIYLIVPNADDADIEIFNIATGALHATVTSSIPQLTLSCIMTANGSQTAYSDGSSIVVLQNSAGTFTEVFVDSAVVSAQVNTIFSICANNLDLVNSIPTLFVYGCNTAGTVWTLNQYQFGASFSSISLLRTIQTWNQTGSPLSNIDCIFNMGALVLTPSDGESKIYYKDSTAGPYSTSNASTYSLPFPTSYTYITQNTGLNGFIDWQPFTVTGSGPPPKSIALSKYNPSTGYAISGVDNFIYSIQINYNTQTITYAATALVTEEYDFVSTYTTSNPILNSAVASFSVVTQTQLGSIAFPSTTITAISRNEITEQFCLIDSGVFKTYTPELTLVTTGTTNIPNSTCLDVRNGEDLSAGLYSIYDMNQVITQINAAFTECFLRLQSQGTTLTKAPLLTLDFQSGLLTLVYDASYLVADRYIAFNDALLAIAYFSNNAGRIILPAPATSLTQSSRTIFNFNDLQSVQFRSNNIFVTGQFYSTNLSSSRIICEIDPDTTTFVNNIGVRLYYNPTILRSFFLNSSLPLQTISIQLFYTTKEGKEYPITLNPSDFFSTKLNFIRKY